MKFSIGKLSRGRLSTMGVGVALTLSLVSMLVGNVVTTMASSASKPSRPDLTATHEFKNLTFRYVSSSTPPPTDKQCRQQQGHPCYSPQEMRTAYSVDKILNRGYTGAGTTICIVDSFGSPTIAADLHSFDVGYGLPDPPSFKIYSPLGTKKWNPHDPVMAGWALETSLDVEWSHAMAPGAKIALLTSPQAETQGIQGMPQMLFLEQYAMDHRICKIFSQSWATTENTLFSPGGRQVLKSFDDFYHSATSSGAVILSSTGDYGVCNGDQDGEPYPFPTVNFPASDPYVTAVGGTSLMANTNGKYQSEAAWSGSGGGVSQYFKEPAYQTNTLPGSDQKILKGYRGLPDISMNADPATSILLWESYNGGSWIAIGGTSESAPLWAGVTADATQLAGHALGPLNDKLYTIGIAHQHKEDIHDITKGNNNCSQTGYNATPGWDAVTGWGSPIAANLLYDL